MIEYRFVAPAERDEAIRMVLQTVGVQDIKAKPVVDKEVVLADTRASHQQFVDNLFAPKDAEAQAKIDKAFSDLLTKAVSGEYAQRGTDYQLSPELTLPRFKDVLREMFLECVHAEPYNVSEYLSHTKWNPSVLRPNRVRELVFKHNLDGAERKSFREVAAELGKKSISGLDSHIWRSIRNINWRLRKEQLLVPMAVGNQATSEVTSA